MKRRLAVVCTGLVGLVACTSEISTGEREGLPDPLPEDTALLDDTVPPTDQLARGVAERLLSDVATTIGVGLGVGDNTCVVDSLSSLPREDLERIGVGGTLLDQPIGFQQAVFSAFDACVSPREFGAAGAPGLDAAGLEQPVAACVYRNVAEQLGFAGMYRYFASANGEVDPVDADRAAIERSYEACDVDLEVIGDPPVSTTVPVPEATDVVVPSTTVVAPVQPPASVVASSIPITLPPTTAPSTTTTPSTSTTTPSTTTTTPSTTTAETPSSSAFQPLG